MPINLNSLDAPARADFERRLSRYGLTVVATNSQTVVAENLAARVLEGVANDLRRKTIKLDLAHPVSAAVHMALLAVADALETQKSILIDPIVAGLAKAMEDVGD